MSNLVYNLFELVLTGLTEFVLNCIKKHLKFFKTILEKNLEFLPYDEYHIGASNLQLILLPVI